MREPKKLIWENSKRKNQFRIGWAQVTNVGTNRPQARSQTHSVRSDGCILYNINLHLPSAPDILAKFLKKSNQALQWTKFLEFWIQVSVARSPRSRKDFFEFLKKYSGVCRHNNLFLCPWGLLGKAKGLPWRSGGLNQSWKLYIFANFVLLWGKKSPFPVFGFAVFVGGDMLLTCQICCLRNSAVRRVISNPSLVATKTFNI